jgi:hypothetical protein
VALAAPRFLGAVREPEDALGVAVRLYRSPGVARSIRRLPLAPDVLTVIRVAAGCPVASAHAVTKTGLDEATLAQVAGLYLLVALFGQDNDAHRTLGLAASATAAEIQDHRNWLLKWLHPDRNRNQMLSGLSVRVLDATAHVISLLPGAAPDGGKAVQPADGERAPKRRRQYRHFWAPHRQPG